MHTRLIIACAQMRPVLGDVAANRNRILELHGEAAAKGAGLVITPELALTGYFLRDLAPEVGLPLNSPTLEPLAAATIDGPDLLCSFVEQREDYRLTISAAHWHRGHLLHVHRKVYLPTYGMFEDERYFAAGDRCLAYPTPNGPAGILICEDWLHPVLPSILVFDGALLLYGCSASPDKGFLKAELGNLDLWFDQLRVYAALFGCPIAWCNRVGFEDGIHFGGRSLILDAAGGVLAQGDPFAEGLVIAELDLGQVRRSRVKAPVVETENLALSIRELTRIQEKGWHTPMISREGAPDGRQTLPLGDLSIPPLPGG
ncbi:MAG TPA: nitrilase-related carbon-nitrogen hydrolase [bacterium]|nr:nitrilase-related carbon-nitrogen hydrolase [bacterium]